MKKLFFIFFGLGLVSSNTYANGCGGEYQPATGTCRIIDSSGQQIYITLASLNLPIVVLPRVKQKLPILMSLQNTVHGQSTLKQVFQVIPSMPIHLLLQKEKPSKPVNKADVTLHVKQVLGSEMAVSPLLKGNRAANGSLFTGQKLLDLPKLRH